MQMEQHSNAIEWNKNGNFVLSTTVPSYRENPYTLLIPIASQA